LFVQLTKSKGDGEGTPMSGRMMCGTGSGEKKVANLKDRKQSKKRLPTVSGRENEPKSKRRNKTHSSPTAKRMNCIKTLNHEMSEASEPSGKDSVCDGSENNGNVLVLLKTSQSEIHKGDIKRKRECEEEKEKEEKEKRKETENTKERKKKKLKTKSESLYVSSWNLCHLGDLLGTLTHHIPGVSSPYIYVGSWKAMFAWHVEDVNLFRFSFFLFFFLFLFLSFFFLLFCSFFILLSLFFLHSSSFLLPFSFLTHSPTPQHQLPPLWRAQILVRSEFI
jgi:hypothetical protein